MTERRRRHEERIERIVDIEEPLVEAGHENAHSDPIQQNTPVRTLEVPLSNVLLGRGDFGGPDLTELDRRALTVDRRVEEERNMIERGEFAHGGVVSSGSGGSYQPSRRWSSRSPESEHVNLLRRGFRMRVEMENPYRPDSYKLYMYSRDRETRRTHVLREFTMETIEEGRVVPETASLSLNQDTLQELMNNLWILGFRPSDSINPDRQIVTVLNQQIEHLRNIINQLLSNPAIRNNT